MLALLVLGAVALAVLVWLGVRLLWAARQLDGLTPDEATQIPVAPAGSVAAKVDARLQRTRAAVETLVMPDLERDEVQPSAGAHRDRAQTYLILGSGLLGLAVVLALGVLLVL